MTFEDLWKDMLKIRPIKKNQKVILTKDQFKTMLKQSYNYGAESQKSTDNPFKDLFGV